MKALLITKVCDVAENNNPLQLAEVPVPIPSDNEVLLKVSACGVCHTDLDEIEGRVETLHATSLNDKSYVIPGHQVIGKVVETGSKATKLKIGNRVGVGWIYSSCGRCPHCLAGNENLCKDFKATGRDVNGGYAEYMTVSEDFAYIIPGIFTDSEAAPLLCAGAVGYRSVKLANIKNGQNVGLTGFGGAGHLSLKTIKHKYPDSRIFVFARSEKERDFAKELGAYWCGDTEDTPPEKLSCIIDTTPAWTPIAEALKHLAPGGRLVINAIRKENKDIDVLSKINYQDYLWMEKEIKSVANVTPADIREFLSLAAEIPIKPEFQEYKLEDANVALTELKMRKIRGSKVLVI